MMILRSNCQALLIIILIHTGQTLGADESLPLPDSDTVVRKIVERAQLNLTNQHKLAVAYYRTNITEEYDSHGEVKERRETVKKVVLQSGKRTTVLVLADGRSPTKKELKREARQKKRRRIGTDQKDPPDRSKQISAFVTTDILSRFEFSVHGREIVDGHSCLLVSFKPGSGQGKSNKMFDRVINQMGGVLWVDEREYEMVKADIQLRKRVTMWGGFLAALDQIQLKIQRARGKDGFWVDRSVEARFSGRALTKRIDIMTWDFTSEPMLLEKSNKDDDAVAAQ